MSAVPTDISSVHRKPEDTAAGCRLLASDDRARAEASDSAHMRVRLTSSAATWTIRAELLERLEARRGSIAREAPSDEAGENDNG
jgi:hypothetical protein